MISDYTAAPFQNVSDDSDWETHHDFMSASSSILTGRLLGGFAPLPRILFVPLFAVSIKDEIEISCASARKRARTQASLCTRRTRRLTKQRRAEAYERARTSRPTFLLCLLHIPSLHSLALCPRLHLLCLLLSCCSAAGDGCDPRFCFFLRRIAVTVCVLLHHRIAFPTH